MKKKMIDNDIVDDEEITLKPLESLESQELKGKLVECKYCNGTGRTLKNSTMGIIAFKNSEKEPCPACGGSGYKRV